MVAGGLMTATTASGNGDVDPDNCIVCNGDENDKKYKIDEDGYEDVTVLSNKPDNESHFPLMMLLSQGVAGGRGTAKRMLSRWQ
jgi:hypothetical protein